LQECGLLAAPRRVAGRLGDGGVVCTRRLCQVGSSGVGIRHPLSPVLCSRAMDDTTPPWIRDGSSAASSEPATVELVENGLVDEEGDEGSDANKESVTHPSKLIRIASMVRTLLDEVRSAPLDDAGRQRMRTIHERSVLALEDVLSDDLRKELSDVVLPFTSETPSESELRIAQAQLVGWLEGLFHGIQATMFSQQAMAQAQLEQLRRRALESGRPVPGVGSSGLPDQKPGAYL
jgi:hypothetical protein